MLIATEAIGVGGVDAVIRSGALAAYGFTEGHVPGGEIAGTVTAVGDGVDTSWIGRRVWAFTGLGGGYAEQAIVPAASRGELHAVIHERLPLDQAVLAHQKMEAGEVFGRIVLTPS